MEVSKTTDSDRKGASQMETDDGIILRGEVEQIIERTSRIVRCKCVLQNERIFLIDEVKYSWSILNVH